ncbi:MAG: hypothetical protein LIR50_05765 [Bacillota bacterium]|nr:hypothetical protein [Bacillota bacterium]
MEKSFITMGATFTLDNEVTLIFKNVSLNFFAAINIQNLDLLFNTKFYMYGIYDTVELLNEKYVIVTKTKKKVELVRYLEHSNK